MKTFINGMIEENKQTDNKCSFEFGLVIKKL